MRTNKCLCTLKGHLSRVWDVSSNKEGTLIASASGDSTIKVKKKLFYKKNVIISFGK